MRATVRDGVRGAGSAAFAVAARGRWRPSVFLLVAGLLLVACAPKRGTIGAMLGQKSDGRVFVREVPDGLAAHKAGLEEGDEILLIDGLDVRTMNEHRLHRALSGEVGEKVKLTVARGTEVLRLTLTRTPARRPAKQRLPPEETGTSPSGSE